MNSSGVSRGVPWGACASISSPASRDVSMDADRSASAPAGVQGRRMPRSVAPRAAMARTRHLAAAAIGRVEPLAVMGHQGLAGEALLVAEDGNCAVGVERDVSFAGLPAPGAAGRLHRAGETGLLPHDGNPAPVGRTRVAAGDHVAGPFLVRA